MKTPSIDTTKSERAHEALDAFAADYLSYQYQFVEFFVDHLVDLSRSFRGDLQLVLILAILGQVKMRAVQDALQGGMDPAEALRLAPTISASRLTDVTGIPRQTIRRKLMALAQRGWAVQHPDQSWSLVDRVEMTSVRENLAGVDARAMARIARLFAELEGIVRRT